MNKIFIIFIFIASSLLANNFSFAKQNISQTSFIFSGNSIVSDKELQEIVHQNSDDKLGYASIEAVRFNISKYYVNKGYINSGATIPMQDFSNGKVSIKIIEGRLTAIHVKGSDGLNASYITNKLNHLMNRPLNTKLLKKELSLLKLDPLIKKIDAKLVPGESKGSATLELNIQTEQEMFAAFSLNNHRSPSIGSINAILSAGDNNLFGGGEKFDFSLGLTKAENDLSNFDGAREYSANLLFPFTSIDVEWFFHADQSISSVIMEPLVSLDIQTTSQNYTTGANWKVYENLFSKIDTGLSYNYKDVATTLGGTPFTLSRGAEDGKYSINSIDWTLSYLYRSQSFVAFIKSTLVQGIDKGVLTEDVPNSKFTLSMLDYYQLIPFEQNRADLTLKLHTQIASKELLFSEKISIGGANTVRGYRENSKSGDNGYFGTLEYQRSLKDLFSSDSNWIPKFVLFADSGLVQDKFTQTTASLYSAGGGVKWKSQGNSFNLYMAHGFSDVPEYEDTNLQDIGIHFDATITLY